MNKQNICPRCFTSGFNENCGTCGYRQEQVLNQNVLRPFKVLQNRYIIGVPIGIGGFGITYAAQNAESGERIAVKEYFPQGIALRNADGTVQVVDGYRQAFRHGLERFSMILKKKQAQSHKRGESPTITLAREIDGTYCCSGQMCFEGHAVSIIGTRSEQQDSYAMLTMHAEQSDGPEALLAIVCDGIGGFSAGQEASSIGVASIIEAFQAAHRPLSDFARTFEEGICLADKRVVALAKALGSKAGTTAVAVYEESGKLYWGCVGDSRAYLLRDSKLSCLTRDHNYALTLQEKVNKGLITQQAADADPERESLISFIGMNDVTHIDTSEHGMTMLDGDVMLLCSDGLYKSLPAAEIADIICQYVEKPSFLPGVLTAAAFDKDLPHQDNTTVIVITCRKDSNKQQEERQL